MSKVFDFLSASCLLLLYVFLFGCSPPIDSPISIKTEADYIKFCHTKIHVELDEFMFTKVSLQDGDKLLSINDGISIHEGSVPSHFISLDGKIYKDFKIESYRTEDISDTYYGNGKRLIVNGICANIEKLLYLEMYEDFPDVLISWCTYTNNSDRDLTIDNVYYNYYHLDRKLVNPKAESYDFRYLQPLNKKWGETWTNVGITDSTKEDFVIPGSGSNRSGIPFIDVWGEEMGMAVFHVEGIPRFLHVLLEVKKDNRVDVGLSVIPDDSYGQFTSILLRDSSITTWKSAVCVHKNDFFDAGRRFGQLLDGALKKVGRDGLYMDFPAQAYEPYWKTWGMNDTGGSGIFTIQEVKDRMDELADYGFKAIMLDDGWFDEVGIWMPDPEKFKDEEDFIEFVREAHKRQWGSNKDQSFKVYLWFDLLGSNVIEGFEHLLVRNMDGSFYKSAQAKYAFCPASTMFNKYLKDTLLNRIIKKWDVDGLYTDWADQNPHPCYAEDHHHTSNHESVENNYVAFKNMHQTIMELKPKNGWTSMCACASVHDIYQYPYYYLGDGSDPVTNKQVRGRAKWIKAVRGPNAPVGDGYVDKMDYDRNAGEPAMSVGMGSVITSVRWKVDELGGSGHAKKWMDLFYSERLYDAEYLGLYDIAYHKPEGYVVKKQDGTMYYSFFDEIPFDKKVVLRGLHPGTEYEVIEYDTGNIRGKISGKTPELQISSTPGNNQGEQVFYYVIKCVPVK